MTNQKKPKRGGRSVIHDMLLARAVAQGRAENEAASAKAAQMFTHGFARAARSGLFEVGSSDGDFIYTLGVGTSFDEAFRDAVDAKSWSGGPLTTNQKEE